MYPFSKPLSVSLWFPNIFGFKGGIQVYSVFLLEALQNILPDSRYDVFLKHDTNAESDFSGLTHTHFHFAGAWPLPLRTGVFASQLLGHGLWRPPYLVITSHLNFTVAAYWLKLLRGVPYWAVAHGVEAWDIQRPVLKTALRHADRILTVSGYTRDRILKEQNLNPARVSVLPNTFDSKRFCIDQKPTRLLQRHQLQPEQPIILTVSRLDASERQKGYNQVLQALPHIRQQLPTVHYILVGKGSDQARIQRLITQLQLEDCVTLTGFVPDSELSDYYNLCDVFVLPSKSEGFGIVYLEALACGKPVLGGNQDGAVDALCHGELGVLVDSDDVAMVAQTLAQVLQKRYPHPLIYQPQLLRQKVLETFGFNRFRQTLANLIEESLMEKSPIKIEL